MYRDSDDEAISGDEDEKRSDLTKSAGSRENKKKYKSLDRSDGANNYDDKRAKRNDTNVPDARYYDDDRDKRTNAAGYRGYRNMYPVIVLDYDLTLVNRSSKPFAGSHDFIEKLRDFNNGRNQLILYSHGSPAYIKESFAKNFTNEQRFFDELIADSSARDNKPISHVRRVVKRLEHLIGPYIIIDDTRSNLDDDQYDICVDVTRMTNYDQRGIAVSVDYDKCFCTMERGVQAFLNTKKK